MGDEVSAYSLVRCSACNGELHPVRPGTEAPEYFCPSAGRTLQVQPGDSVVLFEPREGAPESAHLELQQKMQEMERSQRARVPEKINLFQAVFGILVWIAAIAGVVYWVRSCW